jgi:hypothetical protein
MGKEISVHTHRSLELGHREIAGCQLIHDRQTSFVTEGSMSSGARLEGHHLQNTDSNIIESISSHGRLLAGVAVDPLFEPRLVLVRDPCRSMTEEPNKSRERVVRFTVDGDSKVMVGVAVCEGPRTYRMLLTHPHQTEGRIVDIPRDDIESIDEVEPSPRGTSPSIVES